MVTSLTTREKTVNFDQFSPVPITFILKLTKKLSPGSIGNRPSKLTVFDHIPDFQVFNSNQAIRANQISCQLMEKIGTSIADSEAVSRVLATLCAYALHLGVYSSYFKSRFISVTRAFGFPTQFLLRCLKLLIQPIEMLWISYLVTVASTQQTRNTNIYTNLFRRWWQWLNSWVIYQQRNKPSTRWFEFNRNSRRTASIWQKPRPNYRQRLFALSKPKISIFELKSRFGKLSRTTIPFSFKSWVFIVSPKS